MSEEVHDYNEEFADQADTAFGPQINAQAWSQGEPPPQVQRYRRHSWVRTVSLVVGMVAVAGLIIGALLEATLRPDEGGPPTPPVPAGMTFLSTAPPAYTPPAQTTEAVVPTRPFVAPTQVAERLTPDAEYFRLLWAVNLDPTTAVGGAQGSVNEAHQACGELRRTGLRPNELAAYYHLYRTDITLAQMQGYVHAAVAVYCPEEA